MKKNIAVIGVGAVGIEILRILHQRNFPVGNLRIFARSARGIEVDGISYQVEAISDENFEGFDIALFAGTEGEKGASVLYSDKFIKKGAVVIDNGSDFRLKESVPLVVPEVNREQVSKHQGIISNPNCTTIQAVVALGPIYKSFGLEQFILTSFQATSGAGKQAAMSLWNETVKLASQNKDVKYENLDVLIKEKPEVFSNQIAFNTIAQIGGLGQDGFTSEETKVVNESHKILGDDSIKISATCVRAPVFISHSESIYFVTKKSVSLEDMEKVLSLAEGVVYLKGSLCFPIAAQGKDEVFVSRLRKDPYADNAFWLWSVSDNLRKGAALNAVQIAESLL